MRSEQLTISNSKDGPFFEFEIPDAFPVLDEKASQCVVLLVGDGFLVVLRDGEYTHCGKAWPSMAKFQATTCPALNKSAARHELVDLGFKKKIKSRVLCNLLQV